MLSSSSVVVRVSNSGTDYSIFFDLEEAGRHEYHEPGRFWYRQIEIALLLSSLKRAGWDDRPAARLRRHTLLYGDRGLWKTSIAKKMLNTYFRGNDLVNISIDDNSRFERPVVMDVGGKGISWERARGSASQKGDILDPFFPILNFLFTGELTSFLGEKKQDQQERVKNLNEIMEEGRVTVSLVKMGSATKTKLQETTARLGAMGIKYNSELGIMQYDVGLSILGCSHYLPEDTLKSFIDSGFWSRWHISHYNPTDDEYKGAWKRRAGPSWPHGDQITEFNRRAWATTFENVPYPPDPLLDRVQAAFESVYLDIEEITKRSPREIRSFRDPIDCAQLITAFAVARHVKNADSYTIPVLTYSDEDASQAVRFVEQHMKAKYDEYLARVVVDPNEVSDRKELLAFVEHHNDRDSYFTTAEWRHYAMEKAFTKLSSATAYRKLSDMKNRGWIHSVRKGEWVVGQNIMDIITGGHSSDYGGDE